MLELFEMGKEMMYPLLACSIFALAAIIDRAWAFWSNWRVDTRALRAKVLELLGEGRIKEAAHLCASTPGPISAVLLAGIQAYDRHKPLTDRVESLTSIMDKAMDDYSEHAMHAVEKRFNVLSTVAMASPLLGMTGTVTGMIRAFDEMARQAAVNNAAVAGGMKEALVTTATGLIIAVAAVIPYKIFQSMADRIDLEIEESSSELIDYVASVVETGR